MVRSVPSASFRESAAGPRDRARSSLAAAPALMSVAQPSADIASTATTFAEGSAPEPVRRYGCRLCGRKADRIDDSSEPIAPMSRPRARRAARWQVKRPQKCPAYRRRRATRARLSAARGRGSRRPVRRESRQGLWPRCARRPSRAPIPCRLRRGRGSGRPEFCSAYLGLPRQSGALPSWNGPKLHRATRGSTAGSKAPPLWR